MPAIHPGARGAIITGWGTSLPPKIVTNEDLRESGLDTTDAWIRERTGIGQRHIGGTTAGMSIEAGRQAIERAGVDPSTIDALILATTTPDRTVPATSATVQAGLGLSCGAFDINAACSGFTYALVVAHGMIAVGSQRILVIGTDSLARITDWTDRNTAILFGDGSGAVVLDATDDGGELLGWDIDADGSAERFLYAEVGGSSRWRAGGLPTRRAHHGRLRHQVDEPRRCDRRRHRARGAPPGQHPDHRRRPRPTRHPDGASVDRAGDAPATPRQPRSHWRWPMRSTTIASSPATSSCSSVSAPG